MSDFSTQDIISSNIIMEKNLFFFIKTDLNLQCFILIYLIF
ncbi:hypothetical protein ykris0001_13980 [Yersinia kristensenii ATCC 33638]|nr:hypothetical protein ykris0001_13980 [Yersinia kristensenii ATCC 33638]